ncbi:hypothetical protein DFH27DRAFT_339192 [Peziza echinospora]|nr:hypothetical protein DFH27DRAFT_339192 [Peziza echinospora]
MLLADMVQTARTCSFYFYFVIHCVFLFYFFFIFFFIFNFRLRRETWHHSLPFYILFFLYSISACAARHGIIHCLFIFYFFYIQFPLAPRDMASFITFYSCFP